MNCTFSENDNFTLSYQIPKTLSTPLFTSLSREDIVHALIETEMVIDSLMWWPVRYS